MAENALNRMTFNVASGRGVSILELTRLMTDVAGVDVSPVFLAPDWTAGSIRVGANRLIQDEMGWRATTSIESGLEAVWSWLGGLDG